MKRTLFFTSTVLIILISACEKIPVASFIFSPDSVEVGDIVYFQSTCQNSNKYNWDFGDGSGSSEENPSHIYQAEGNFSVVLVASNEDGSDKTSKTITVSQSYPCWTQLANLNLERFAHMMAVVDDRIYVMGGNNSGTEEYDPVTDTWTIKAGMPTRREYVSGCEVNGKIYALGGWQTNITSADVTLSTVEEYDPVTDTWIEKASMPTARWGHAAAEVDGKIYVLGGVNGWYPIFYNTVEIYDPELNTWTTVTPSPEGGIVPRWCLSACVVNGKIYTLGGLDADRNPPNGQSIPALGIVEEYDPVSNTWVEKAAMPTARWGTAAAAVDGKIYVFGGARSFWVEAGLPVVEVYDPVDDTWETLSDMPENSMLQAACELNQIIYLAGGGDLTIEVGYPDFYEYDPACEITPK